MDHAPWQSGDILATRAATTPERTALVDASHQREWSYRALDTLVDDVAATVQNITESDGETERRVACMLSTRVAFVVAFYATQRVGTTVVPLNTELAMPAFESLVNRVDPDLLLCEGRSERIGRKVASCPVASVDEPQVDGVQPLLTSETTGAEHVEAGDRTPHETAVVMFTSGTTGDPKGVRLTWRNLITSAIASAFRLGVTPGDRWLCCLPPYHMGGLAPVVRTVLYGTTLVLQPQFDREETVTVLARENVTGISLVPTQLQRLLDGGWTPPSSLRTVLLGGAPATESLVERALDAGVPVHPTYGMTETASQVATARPETAREEPTTVGQPLLWTRVTVVDDGTPCDAGETGELVVDGPTVTPGYLNDERTADTTGEFGLHTGDIGFKDEDGRLWVVGRSDDIIMTGGELVVPDEVADRLGSHPHVADAAVVGLDDEEWGEKVTALVVPAPDGAPADEVTADELLAHCEETLASFKQPKEIVFADELPRTPSGTVDREAVRDCIRERLDGV